MNIVLHRSKTEVRDTATLSQGCTTNMLQCYSRRFRTPPLFLHCLRYVCANVFASACMCVCVLAGGEEMGGGVLTRPLLRCVMLDTTTVAGYQTSRRHLMHRYLSCTASSNAPYH